MAFIPADKMKILREAAAKGDANARKIIDAHFQKKDYAADLDAYFAPKAEKVAASEPVQMQAKEPGEMPEDVSTGNAKLDEFLRGNGVKKGDPDYEDALEDYYREFPNERPEGEAKAEQGQGLVETQPQNQDVSEEMDMTKEIAQGIIDLIGKCDATSLAIMQNDDIDDTTKKGALGSLQEIKEALFDGAEKIKKIKHSFDKKEEQAL